MMQSNTTPRTSGMPLADETASASTTSIQPTLETAADEASRHERELLDSLIAAVDRRISAERRPLATYRVQFNGQCRFGEATAFVPYLYTLGISDLYASPFLKAAPGSTHGYDICDHGRLNEEIGEMDDLVSLSSALREHDMGLIADVVPNHMCNIPGLNAWWQDVLENGPSSRFSNYFDIDWMPLKPDLANKVLLPVLGDQFGRVLERGELKVRYRNGSFWLEYYEKQFPLAPRSYLLILGEGLAALQEKAGAENLDLLEFLSIITAIRNLPPRTESDPERLDERRREKEVIKRRLHELEDRSDTIAEYIEECVAAMNGQAGDSASFDRLDRLLDDQAYRLAYWRVAADEINYRRFFDINELAAICTEDPEVFAATHRLIFDLVDAGIVTGLRIDHPDGLYDPRGYFQQLQERRFLQLLGRELDERGLRAEPDGRRSALEKRLTELWRNATRIPGSPLSRVIYVVVEKILAHGEQLPDNWPVHGTVGYEFLNVLNGLFVSPAGEIPMTSTYARVTGEQPDFESLAYHCKRLITKISMGSETTVLGYRLDRISERNRLTRDFTLSSLTRALQDVIACFGVYRTYVDSGEVLERDARYIGDAINRAKRRNRAMSASIFEFIHDSLLLRFNSNADESERRGVRGFAGKFQQLSGPIMAKAVEDTAFYRYNRLISLNEVGGHPERFSVPLDEFHGLNTTRQARFPHALNGSSTHDTKRGEDVRARISVLSEVPDEWLDVVQKWFLWNASSRPQVDGIEVPGPSVEYLAYQTLVGIWPMQPPSRSGLDSLLERLRNYMLKVVREAKVDSSWINPNEAYEAALCRFVDDIFAGEHNRFRESLDDFATRIAEHGMWNSLSQLVLKIASPGVPDFFQGSEHWLLTLVDPDNRGRVDFSACRQSLDRLLDAMAETSGASDRATGVDRWIDPETLSGPVPDASTAAFLKQLLEERRTGRIKLYTTMMGLRLRRRWPELFVTGDYQPVRVEGAFAGHVVAFARSTETQRMIVVVPRLTVGLVGFGGPEPIGDIWQETRVVLPESCPSRYWDVPLSRQTLEASVDSSGAPVTIRVADALRHFPVAFLVSRSS